MPVSHVLGNAAHRVDVVTYLLDAGTDPQPVVRRGRTPLSDAEANGHTPVGELLRQAIQITPKEVAA